MRINTLVVGLMLFLLIGFSGPLLSFMDSRGDTEGDYVEQRGDGASMNWTTHVLRVKGNGFGPDKVKHLGRRKILAKRAAKMDAYRNLSESVKGVLVTSHTRVEDMMLESDSIKARTESMLKGVQVVAVNYSKEGGCEITVEVNIDQYGGFLLTALNNGEIKVTDNYPRFDWAAALKDLEQKEKQLAQAGRKLDSLSADLKKKKRELAVANQKLDWMAGQVTDIKKKPLTPGKPVPDQPGRKKIYCAIYTGLLVDARGFNLKPALYPSILNEKEQKMYGRGAFSTGPHSPTPYVVGDIGIVQKKYGNKIGKNPLIVKCKKPVGETRSDIMISNDDAMKVVLIHHLLEQERVAVLR